MSSLSERMKKPSKEFEKLTVLRNARDRASPSSCKTRREKFDVIRYYRAREAYHAQLLKVYPKAAES